MGVSSGGNNNNNEDTRTNFEKMRDFVRKKTRRRIDDYYDWVPRPGTQFCIHMTIRSIQTAAVVGSVLGPVSALLMHRNEKRELVASYICETAREQMQIIVISLKEEFYNKADSLVGIFPHPAACTTSGVLTFDLTRFKQIGINEMTENPPPATPVVVA